MKLTEIFITRPVMTALLMIGIVLFGVAGYRSLPVSDLPNVDFPTIQVSAGLPGASPETMAASVATTLERQFATISGIDSMTSSSGIGSTSITIQFTLDRSIDAAAQDVQNAIAAALRKLPPGMPTPPSIQKVNPADQPVLFMTLSSPTLALSVVDEYAENLMAQRISSLPGVAQVGEGRVQVVPGEVVPAERAAELLQRAGEVLTADQRALLLPGLLVAVRDDRADPGHDEQVAALRGGPRPHVVALTNYRLG